MSGAVSVDVGSWKAEVINSKTPVLVDFWHDSCVWCKKLEPIYDELSGEFSGKVKFAKLNVLTSDENNKLASEYGVQGTPTLILFCQGKPIGSIVGFRLKGVLKEEIQHLMETHEDCFKQQTPLGGNKPGG
ncbi:thioredoxin fold domain-containing protein [Candidatus Micrarchaeota archaeon]|nr:thioredoxin fold domain-containing protein [Candidatus Micrarchaeota archaeon]MBI5176525.1 thioredoxin fold domain-containing protein [Candidatus Micrarchaeota archaeon]